MDPYQPQQPDEGYSEHPLSGSGVVPYPVKSSTGDADTTLLTSVLTRHISSLPMASKIRLAENILESLPTHAIVHIVQKLNPRLYIDFIHYLPAEICLNILRYLDPLSLMSVARSCRAWYDLALDRKLWERLYHLEGWKTITSEIHTYEDRISRDRPSSSEDGRMPKRRAISSSRQGDGDWDHAMPDADRSSKSMATDAAAGALLSSSNVSEANFDSLSPRSIRKGKQRAQSPPPRSDATAPRLSFQSSTQLSNAGRLPKSTLWVWDTAGEKFRMNWKHLYTLRRRLETNWDLGKFTNFQFPHPEHPEEAHGECIYTIQFNAEYLVSGSRDRTIRIWSLKTRRLIRPPLVGHRLSVLCLQFDSDPEEDIIVSGSSDSTVIVWKFSTGEILQRIKNAHREPVLNVKFDKNILVTCSKDKTIKIFNRRELRAGDLGYGETFVQPVPTHLKNYNFDGLDQLPLKPPYTILGSLEGHSAAVNAVQIHGREIVSASGDRNVKIWDWPTMACVRTLIGHSKGIACVQYDGRRIVSGSSDNEVKVFDRRSGLEVASLRSHSNLVRTVQAGFGDLPFSTEEDEKEAAKVDERYLEAVQNGTIAYNPPPYLRRHSNRAQVATDSDDGVFHPENVQFTGAKLPPGGGGGQYGRIVSGSYDTTIIIWRRNKRGVWKAQQHLKQEEAAAAAAAPQATRSISDSRSAIAVPSDGPRHRLTQTALHVLHQTTNQHVLSDPTRSAPSAHEHTAVPSSATTPMHVDLPDIIASASDGNIPSHPHLTALIDTIIAHGAHSLQQALTAYPGLLDMDNIVQAAIDRHPSPFVRSQLRQTLGAAQVRAHIARVQHGGSDTTADEGGARTLVSSSHADGVSLPGTLVGSQPTTDTVIPVALTTETRMPSGPANAILPPQTVSLAAIERQRHAPAATPTTSLTAGSAPQPSAHDGVPIIAGPTGHPPHHTHHHPPHHPHMRGGAEASNPARIFKLQYDARRIICCSQTPVIVGWDFCNGDSELEEAARFFGTIE